jgi:outer membrane protein OmpA-like peptidoglycan-associated protein
VALKHAASLIREKGKGTVRIEGHSDAKGADAYNQTLSENRARAVKHWLVKNTGAAAGRITTRGWGKSKPVVPNTQPDGSDRVEIIVNKD